jgi:hypothetical protein
MLDFLVTVVEATLTANMGNTDDNHGVRSNTEERVMRNSRHISAWILMLGLCVLETGSARAAGGFDTLAAHASRTEEVIVGVDHRRLKAHPDREPLLRLAVSRALLPSVVLDAGACLTSGSELHRSVSVRDAGARTVHVLEGVFDTRCTEAFYRKKSMGSKIQKKPSSSGTIAGKPSVAVNRNQSIVFLNKRLAFVANAAVLESYLKAVLGKKKDVLSGRESKRLYRAVTKKSPLVWAFSIVPKRIRKRYAGTADADFSHVKSFYLSVYGHSGADAVLMSELQTKTQAKKLKSLVTKRIESRVGDSLLLRAMGVSGMIQDGIKLSTKGANLEAKIKISPLQMAILARYAGKILAILE